MPLPASPGAISLSAIQTEFTGSNPISISEYYRGTIGVALVPDITVNNNVPTGSAGVQISFANFHAAEQIDYIPNTFSIGNLSSVGDDTVQSNSSSITITGINTPIKLNIGTTNGNIQRSAAGFGVSVITTVAYVNNVQANSFNWSRNTNGTTTAIVRNMKITVSSGDTLIIGFIVSVGGDSGDGTGTSSAITYTVSNDSSSNTSLATFTAEGSVTAT